MIHLNLKIIYFMPIHLATGHDLCPMGLTCCEVTVGKLHFRHTLIVWKKLEKEFVIGLEMLQLYHLGWDWTMDGWMFLHQGADILIYSIKAVVNNTSLKTISNIQTPIHCIANIPTK